MKRTLEIICAEVKAKFKKSLATRMVYNRKTHDIVETNWYIDKPRYCNQSVRRKACKREKYHDKENLDNQRQRDEMSRRRKWGLDRKRENVIREKKLRNNNKFVETTEISRSDADSVVMYCKKIGKDVNQQYPRDLLLLSRSYILAFFPYQNDKFKNVVNLSNENTDSNMFCDVQMVEVMTDEENDKVDFNVISDGISVKFSNYGKFCLLDFKLMEHAKVCMNARKYHLIFTVYKRSSFLTEFIRTSVIMSSGFKVEKRWGTYCKKLETKNKKVVQENHLKTKEKKKRRRKKMKKISGRKRRRTDNEEVVNKKDFSKDKYAPPKKRFKKEFITTKENVY